MAAKAEKLRAKAVKERREVGAAPYLDEDSEPVFEPAAAEAVGVAWTGTGQIGRDRDRTVRGKLSRLDRDALRAAERDERLHASVAVRLVAAEGLVGSAAKQVELEVMLGADAGEHARAEGRGRR